MEPFDHRRVGSTSWASRRDKRMREAKGRRPGVEPLESRRLLTTLHEFALPSAGTGGNMPEGITAQPNGQVWFTKTSSNQVDSISTSGTLGTPISVGAVPEGIIYAGGEIWVAEKGAGAIGRIDPVTHQYTEFPVPTSVRSRWGSPTTRSTSWSTSPRTSPGRGGRARSATSTPRRSARPRGSRRRRCPTPRPRPRPWGSRTMLLTATSGSSRTGPIRSGCSTPAPGRSRPRKTCPMHPPIPGRFKSRPTPPATSGSPSPAPGPGPA